MLPSTQAPTRLRVTLIPPEQWLPRRRSYQPGLEPRLGAIDQILKDEHGIDMEVLDPADFSRVPLVKEHPLYSGLDPMRAWRVLTQRRDVDLVISVFESSSVWPLLLRRVMRFKPPIAMWDIAPEENWLPRKVIQNIVVPRVDQMFLLSSHQSTYIEQRWQAGARTSTVGQHVDTEFFAPVAPGKPTLGPILAIGDDHGRDWTTFLAAVSDLDVDVIIKTRHPIDLTVPRRCRLTRISERLSFVALRELYAQASMVVIPLKHTLNVSGVGSVLEALSMGKPLILSRNPPVQEYVEDQVSAVLVDLKDVQGMQRAIADLMQRPDQQVALGLGARERALAVYSRRAFTGRLADEIRRVVARHRHP